MDPIWQNLQHADFPAWRRLKCTWRSNGGGGCPGLSRAPVDLNSPNGSHRNPSLFIIHDSEPDYESDGA